MSNQSSESIYSPLVLKLYDFWVLVISNRFAWKCQTNRYLLPFFQRRIKQNHLDVGVGTGFYTKQASVPNGHLTLLDLNQHCLGAAAARCHPRSVKTILHNVFQPLPTSEQFDSISIFYLLHCLPGTMAAKEPVISNLKNNLTSSGTLFGATILGNTAGHNCFGRALMRVYNKKGIFGNRQDTEDELNTVLRKHFNEVSVVVRGTVALFECSKPIRNAHPSP